MTPHTRLALAILTVAAGPNPVLAAESMAYKSPALTARLISAEDGVRADTRTISAGMSLTLAEGWKTYWRSPGEVGVPPDIDWAGSSNLDEAEIQWPAPTRFRAFGIENFGYEKEVTYPILLTLDRAGKPVDLKARISVLVCSNVCVPLKFDLSLSLPIGTGIDQASAEKIASWSTRVPDDGRDSGISIQSAALVDDPSALVVEFLRAGGWAEPDIFPELGESTAFGAPDIRRSDDRETLWARFPILSLSDPADPLTLTVTDGSTASTFRDISIGDTPAGPPFTKSIPGRSYASLAWIALLAFAGGVILNAMPCVLPILSIKLSSALKLAGGSESRVRTGFLVTAFGAVAFMWILAALVLVAQAAGYAVGWGTQYQNPFFLVFLILVLCLFAANLFGLYEFRLPARFSNRLAGVTSDGYAGDFATGAFAAVLATPCSAPLLGTAVAFAFTGSTVDVVLIFTAMGLGLALPYLAIAARPTLVFVLPRPGKWMIAVKTGLGLLLSGTSAWLFWILAGVASPSLAMAVAIALAVAVISLGFGKWITVPILSAAIAVTASAVALGLPAFIGQSERAAPVEQRVSWINFQRRDIARHVSDGHVVFVDVTADWCLTCKANKTLVLDRSPVVDALAGPTIIPMRADWTRPDPNIQSYLESKSRFGIPFNIVYGPAAPEGIPLSEFLTPGAVMDALDLAFGAPVELANQGAE